MPTVAKSAIVPASRERMFQLVDAVERYPEFLPWCPSTEVLGRDAGLTRARLDVDFRGLRTSLTTVNRKHAPERMTLELVDGPFESFAGEWRFTALGEGGCKVELVLDYEFENRALAALLGPLFGHIAATMVESFVRRAESPA